jgi:hypothetical protein
MMIIIFFFNNNDDDNNFFFLIIMMMMIINFFFNNNDDDPGFTRMMRALPERHGKAMIRASLGRHLGKALFRAKPESKTREARLCFQKSKICKRQSFVSRNQSPDNGRKATTSWRSHDVGFAHTSSGLRPDDHFY